MRKYIYIYASALIFIFYGCSSSIDTTNFTPSQKLGYAEKLYNNEDYQEALDEFNSIILQYPGSSIIDEAQYYLGMTRYHRGEYILAALKVIMSFHLITSLIKNIQRKQSRNSRHL